MMKAELWLGLAGFAILCITNIVIITRYVSTIDGKITEKFNSALSLLKKEFDSELKIQRHEFAETLKPMQTHIALYEKKHYKLELYIRDNYIEVPTFQGALNDLKEDINAIAKKLDKLNEDSVAWRRSRSN